MGAISIPLERIRLQIRHLFEDADFADGLHQVECTVKTEFDKLVIELSASVVATNYGIVRSVYWPANWREALKERFAPVWLLARWPVQYAGVDITGAALYPMIPPALLNRSIAYFDVKPKDWKPGQDFARVVPSNHSRF